MPGLVGVISGRALYDGRIDLAEAVSLLAAPAAGGRLMLTARADPLP